MSEIRTPNQDDMYRILTEARRIRAEHFAVGVSRVGRAIVGFARAIGTAFAEARRQQALYEELSRMTDFELRDIGLNRSDIPAVVAGVLTRETGRKASPAETAAEANPAPAALPASPPSDRRIAA
ncbi:DUF1127 domain-containing protein [Virgifigura deserti]|uniref:DUF1127 domain-containing protein n=1 Tax=Virgifigura deserti TaxID=2268457 RepID=UPI003CCC4011